MPEELCKPAVTSRIAVQFTMESFLSVFEHFIGSYKVLLDNGAAEVGSISHRELCDLVASRVSIYSAAVPFTHAQNTPPAKALLPLAQ